MDAVRTFLLDSFQVTPLLLVMAMFFLGVLTSNIGMLLSAVGAMLIAPTFHILSTQFSNPVASAKTAFATNPFLLILGGLFYLVGPALLAAPIQALAIKGEDNPDSTKSYGAFAVYAILILGYLAEKPPGQMLNPLRWFSSQTTGLTGADARSCALLPPHPGQTVYSFPSLWTLLYSFIFGLLLTNAVELYRLPPPSLSTVPSPALKDSLDKQETTRKQIALASIALLSLITIGVLYYRTSVVGCDSYLDIPLFAWAAAFGAGWYAILTKDCGIRATDLFGIVSSYVPPSALNKPIVCTT
jgi:hypothetical protein